MRCLYVHVGMGLCGAHRRAPPHFDVVRINEFLYDRLQHKLQKAVHEGRTDHRVDFLPLEPYGYDVPCVCLQQSFDAVASLSLCHTSLSCCHLVCFASTHAGLRFFSPFVKRSSLVLLQYYFPVHGDGGLKLTVAKYLTVRTHLASLLPPPLLLETQATLVAAQA